MKHKEGNFQNIRGESLYFQSWLPKDKPIGILFLVHGLSEHSGRYMNVVNHFVPKGYAVYGIDHLGHGQSSGLRNYINRFEDFTVPLSEYLSIIKGANEGIPVFLLGHSLGGLISSVLLISHQSEFAGAIISAPTIKVPENVSSGIIMVGKILSKILPKLPLIGFETDGVSSDPKVVEAYFNDPFTNTEKATARLSAEILLSMNLVEDQASKINLPILILQGSGDTIVPPEGAEMLHNLFSSEDKELIIYDGFYHEILNEPEHQRVLTDIENWLERLN